MLRPLAPRLGHGLQGDAPAPAGTRAAQPRLADGTLLDDRVGHRFAVLASPHLVDALSGAARARLAGDDVVVVTAEGKAADYLADLCTGAVVIRPDRYILGTASTPAELDAVLARRQWPVGSKDVSRRTQKVAAII
jgi:3-(3-hydroxy-phenyl)propionate hydroxylase